MEDVSLTSEILSCFSLGLIFYVLRDICNYAFFARGDSKTPCNVSIIVVLINIINNYILSSLLGIKGIALATSISGLIAFLMLYKKLVNYIGKIEIIDKNNMKYLVIASISMISVIKVINWINLEGYIWMISKMLIALFVYFLIHVIFNIKYIKNRLLKVREYGS